MIPVTQIKTLTEEGKLQEILCIKLMIFVFGQRSWGASSSFCIAITTAHGHLR